MDDLTKILFSVVLIMLYNCACGYGYEISKADNGTHITSSVYEGPNDGGNGIFTKKHLKQDYRKH